MDEKKNYYLMPGKKIGNPGLPKGQLFNDGKSPKKIDPKHVAVIAQSVDFLVVKGILSEGVPEPEEKKRGRPTGTGKGKEADKADEPEPEPENDEPPADSED